MGGRHDPTVGDQEWAVDGFGLRDHSWGPRYWQAPFYYRWLTANFGEDFGFMGSRVARRDGPGTRGGFVWDGDARLHLCHDFEISTDLGTATTATTRSRPPLRSKDEEWSVTGSVGHRLREPHPQSPQPTQRHGHPHLRGHDRVDARRRSRRLRPLRSTSTRSSTAKPVGLDE